MKMPTPTAIVVQPDPQLPTSPAQASFSVVDEEDELIERPMRSRLRRDASPYRRREVPHPSFGVAALVVSIVAFGLCVVPFLGMALAGLAFVLSIVSFLRRESAGYAIAGFFLSLMAFVPNGFYLYVASTHDPLKGLPVPVAADGNRAGPKSPDKKSEPRKLSTIGEPVDIGQIRVTLVSVRFGKVPLEGGPRNGHSKDDLLSCELLIENKSSTKIASISGWGGERMFRMHEPSLVDDLGNRIRCVSFGVFDRPSGQLTKGEIYPGKRAGDVVVFDPLPDAAKSATLTLPASGVGGAGEIQFAFPASKIERQ